jgi:colanic acid/amylovoran biosynthesis glycosyltransferase
LIVPRFPRLSETFLVNKFVGLVDAGWDVHVVCHNTVAEDWEHFPALRNRPDLRHRVHTHWAHDSRWMAALLWLPALSYSLLKAPQTTWRYWRETWRRFGGSTFRQFYLDAAIIALDPDILHFEFGALAAERVHLKQSLQCYLTTSFRGYDLEYAGLEEPGQYQQLWANADALHLLSHSLWQRALSRGCPPGMPHALIPPAIDTTYFVNDETAPDTVPISEARPLRILSVGRLEWVKGYEYALDSVRLLRERGVPFEFHIVGAGNYLEPLAFARYEMDLEREVVFLGAQSHAAVVDEMNWADVLVHAAVSEGFCNVVLEAQAMRLPVVCSDAGGLKENVAANETGFIVSRRDPEAMADKLAQLAEDADLRQRMGAAGRRRVQECFQLPDQIVAFDSFYRGVIGI